MSENKNVEVNETIEVEVVKESKLHAFGVKAKEGIKKNSKKIIAGAAVVGAVIGMAIALKAKLDGGDDEAEYELVDIDNMDFSGLEVTEN